MKSFLDVIKENHENEMWSIHPLGDNKHLLDYGNSVVFAGIIATNAIMSKSGCQTVPLKSLLDESIIHERVKSDPRTLEEFIFMTDKFAHLDYTNIIKKFKSVLADECTDIILPELASRIGTEELTKIKEALENDVTELEIIVNNLIDDDVSSAGYPLWEIPIDKVNDAMHYAKDAIINIIKDAAKDIWDIITGQNQIDLMPKLPNPEAFTFQQLPQPLVAQQSVFTPVPNYTGNEAIMKHFVIGNNVVIYDPNQQQMFEKDLVDLSKALDEVDKELGLKEPSKYGFEQFTNSLNFKAVRLDKDGKYINNSDSDNYIAIWTDKSTLYIKKPSKATA